MTNPASSSVPGYPDPDTMGDIALLLNRGDIPTNPMNQIPRINSQNQLVDKDGQVVSIKPKYTAVLDLEVEKTAAAAEKNRVTLQQALNDLDTSGGAVFFRGGGHFRDGFATSSRIMLLGENENAPITFEPTVAGTQFFLWQRRRFDADGNQLPRNPSSNSEWQLEACGAKDLVILGNRQTRGHALELRGCDHAVIHNLHIRGIAGTSLNLQHVREYHIYGYVGRFNGYVHPTDPAQVTAAFVWGGERYAGFENGNLSTFHGVQEAFSFGPCMDINGPFKNSIIGGMVHMLAPTNPSLENIIVEQFGGALGWDADGNPRNILAALMSGGPNVAGISGRRMLRGLASCSTIQVRGKTQNLNLDHVNVVGHSGMHLVRVDDESEVLIGSGAYSAASAARFAVTADQATSLFTVTEIEAGLIAQVPETGTPGEFTALSSSALPIVLGTRVYVIRVSDTTFRLADSYANAIAGTHIVLTSAGSGLKFTCGGQMLYATRDSEICVDRTAHFNDGYVIAAADETSFITSFKQPGNRRAQAGEEEVFGAGPQLPAGESEQLLFQARNVALNAANTDVMLRKQFRGSRFIATRVQVIRRSGGATSVSGNLQIHTATGGGGTALLTNPRTGASAGIPLAGLTAQNQVIEAVTRPATSIPVTGGSGATFAFVVSDNGTLQAVNVLSGGTGYADQSNLAVTGLNGATVSTTTSGGAITGVTVTNQGSGYVRASNVVTALQARMDAASGNAAFRFDVRVYGRVID